MKPMIGIKSWP